MTALVGPAIGLAMLAIGGAGIYAVTSDAGSPSVEEWEHGFKTSHIIATRYKNPVMGYNIGFRYTTSHYDNNGDRAEVMDFFTAQKCWIYQGGGMPYSEYFVKCEGVTDKDTANARLKTLLPALDQFVGKL